MIVAKQIFSLNEQGKRRNNEDNIYPPKGSATTSDKLFMVCDGVGGESKGEVASEMVCTAIHQYISKQQLPLADGQETIENAILFANDQLADYVSKDVSAERMSTTLTLILMKQQSVFAAWCGDTRIHHIRNGRVLWKSDDHSLVHELVKSGEISQAEARTHPRRNVITRCLNGQNVHNEVDFHEITDCQADDFFLLCTDGFLEQVDDDVLYEVLNNDEETNKAESFLQVCEGKTRDNFSMYLVKVAEMEAMPDPVVLSTPQDKASDSTQDGMLNNMPDGSSNIVQDIIPSNGISDDPVNISSKNVSGYRWWLVVLAIIIVIAGIVLFFMWKKKNEQTSQQEVNRLELIRESAGTIWAGSAPAMYELYNLKM